MKKFVTSIAGCLMLLLASGTFAQEVKPGDAIAAEASKAVAEVKEAVVEVIPVGVQYKFEYSVEDLKKAADEKGSASVNGVVTKLFADGTTSTANAKFSISKDGDKYSSVSYVEIDDFFTTSNVFMMFCSVLVFIMHLGFATLETGLCRAKNAVNILFKNVAVVAIGTIIYAIIGFNLMYPCGQWIAEGWFPKFVPFLSPGDQMGPTYAASNGYTYWTDFLFQAMFAAATASIVSGAVCERIKLSAFLVFSIFFAGFVYPILGAAHWGGGFLAGKGFHDLAGSTLVHSVGGWGALAGAIVLGPRIGKFVNGKSVAIMGHNMPLATIGCMLLWFGWFGFNAGSQLNADPKETSHIMVSTLLSSCGGIISAMIVSWIIQKRPDLSMILNGSLAGLVGITAGANIISGFSAVYVGLISGVIVVFAVMLVEKLKIDDPVGALAVHLCCGIWGTIACAVFGGKDFMIQLTGIAYYALAFPAALLIFFIIKITIGIRVSEIEEIEGLDVGEHGMEAYSGFQIFTNQ